MARSASFSPAHPDATLDDAYAIQAVLVAGSQFDAGFGRFGRVMEITTA